MSRKPDWDEFDKKWESLYVFTGHRSDLTTLLSMAIIDPMILYVFIGYVAGRVVSLPLLFLIMDGILLLRWIMRIKKRKKWLEIEREDAKGRMDRIKKKINELEDIE